MKLQYFFLGVVFFSVIFGLGFNFLEEGEDHYGVPSGAGDSFNKMTQTLRPVNDIEADMKDKIEGGTVTDQSAVDEMVAGGYTAIRSGPFNTLAVAGNATMVFAQETGLIDDQLIWFFYIILSTLVLFAIIALIFRFRSN